ncbi:B-cell CLL/lymphoma 6 member B protein isoform X2 [Neodiprion virginianus]|uniref:B-cell CLL/lymphoma 6 member B protein isoform X2 n=1 Tax=Neodiprion virginianus TaxID=2961670 RepID=UPI001EE70119|nr:B-cell CLL/lymphoma 6 member B protein isoform X2 [Neodiprion virginianus]
MYNLYRAWFGSESCNPLETRSSAPVGPAIGLSPPDTLIRVGNDGEHQFVAHRSVLAAHSGYLKALLATSSNVAPGTTAATSVASLSVSSVGGEAFAPLLNYMYTGRLEVTLDNIYSVLLATHLLHMPGALDQCRAALLKLRAPPVAGGVLRPVPSRVVGPPLCWPPPASLYSSGTLPLPTLGVPAAVSISGMPTPISRESHNVNSNYNGEKSVSPKPSTSQQIPRSPARSLTPDASRRSENISRTPRGQRSPSPAGSAEKISVTDSEPARGRKCQRTTSDPQGNGSGSNVVIDIACCDGPVRFHRVLNVNYSGNDNGEDSCTGLQQQQQQQQQRVCEIETVGENDENVCDVEEGIQGIANSVPNEAGHYTCGYCRHTFKSQYCYQKHARRHLHPANSDGQTSGRRREVRLLDLNVQYYPCKICGSKFPSYYFVHKHRKLCHGSDDNQSGSDESNANNFNSKLSQ